MDFYRESRLQLSDNFSIVSGGHALKFGADFNNIRDTSQIGSLLPGARDISQPARFSGAIAGAGGFLVAVGERHDHASGASRFPSRKMFRASWRPRQNQLDHNSYGFFGQDEWKVTQKLTLTSGPALRLRDLSRCSSSVRPEQFSAARGPRLRLQPPHRRARRIRNIQRPPLLEYRATADAVQLGSAGNEPNAKSVFPDVARAGSVHSTHSWRAGSGYRSHVRHLSSRRTDDNDDECGATRHLYLHVHRRGARRADRRRRHQPRLQA